MMLSTQERTLYLSVVGADGKKTWNFFPLEIFGLNFSLCYYYTMYYETKEKKRKFIIFGSVNCCKEEKMQGYTVPLFIILLYIYMLIIIIYTV